VTIQTHRVALLALLCVGSHCALENTTARSAGAGEQDGDDTFILPTDTALPTEDEVAQLQGDATAAYEHYRAAHAPAISCHGSNALQTTRTLARTTNEGLHPFSVLQPSALVNRKILNIGSGFGLFEIDLFKYRLNVWGVDIAPPDVLRSNDRFVTLDIAQDESAFQKKVKSSSFDVVFVTYSFFWYQLNDFLERTSFITTERILHILRRQTLGTTTEKDRTSGVLDNPYLENMRRALRNIHHLSTPDVAVYISPFDHSLATSIFLEVAQQSGFFVEESGFTLALQAQTASQFLKLDNGFTPGDFDRPFWEDVRDDAEARFPRTYWENLVQRYQSGSPEFNAVSQYVVLKRSR